MKNFVRRAAKWYFDTTAETTWYKSALWFDVTNKNVD
jgi:hypothetical protein